MVLLTSSPTAPSPSVIEAAHVRLPAHTQTHMNKLSNSLITKMNANPMIKNEYQSLKARSGACKNMKTLRQEIQLISRSL